MRRQVTHAVAHVVTTRMHANSQHDLPNLTKLCGSHRRADLTLPRVGDSVRLDSEPRMRKRGLECTSTTTLGRLPGRTHPLIELRYASTICVFQELSAALRNACVARPAFRRRGPHSVACRRARARRAAVPRCDQRRMADAANSDDAADTPDAASATNPDAALKTRRSTRVAMPELPNKRAPLERTAGAAVARAITGARGLGAAIAR
jgi:hypothetical protein